jgi:hypothetical protein
MNKFFVITMPPSYLSGRVLALLAPHICNISHSYSPPPASPFACACACNCTLIPIALTVPPRQTIIPLFTLHFLHNMRDSRLHVSYFLPSHVCGTHFYLISHPPFARTSHSLAGVYSSAHIPVRLKEWGIYRLCRLYHDDPIQRMGQSSCSTKEKASQAR